MYILYVHLTLLSYCAVPIYNIHISCIYTLSILILEYITPQSKVIEATTAGYTAAESLQNAIDYVKDELTSGDFKDGQKKYLISNLKECRECLFDFLDYMPQEDLLAARKRVEEGTVLCVMCNVYDLYTRCNVHHECFRSSSCVLVAICI